MMGWSKSGSAFGLEKELWKKKIMEYNEIMRKKTSNIAFDRTFCCE